MNEQKDMAGIKKHLSHVFESIEQPIPIFLFAEKGVNDVFSDAARQVITFFRGITDKIIIKEHNLKHARTRKWKITRSPTIVISPDKYQIRWLGAPVGEESRTFIEMLLLVGLNRSGLSEPSTKILNKIKDKRHIKVFVSPGCPYCPQQAVNALKAAVDRPDIISLEIIDIQANPELAEKYAAHSVPQTYANDVLIAQGAQPEELFMSSLEKMEQQNIFIPESDATEVKTDLVIVGAGPAGLTAGIYAARSGLNAVIVEKGVLGGQVALTPVVENYPGLKQIGGKTLVDIMVTHALEYTQIFPGEGVMEIVPGNPIVVKTTRRKFITRTLLIATGATHRKLDVPGEDRLAGHGVSYCSTCDGPLFKDRKVIIAGGGDSAVTEALHLKNIGVDVTLVHRRDKLRAQEILASKITEYGIPVKFNTEVREIRGKKEVREVLLHDHVNDKEETMAVDGVFISIGYTPAVEPARSIGVELTPDGFIKQDSFRTNIPGVYAAGDVVGGFKQIVTASGQGAGAAMTIFEDLINPYWKDKRQ